MRLIDADELQNEIERLIGDYDDPSHKVIATDIMATVEIQPTAYDLESVIEHLEDRALEHAINGQQYGEDSYDMHENIEQAIKQGIEEAIEIVKSVTTATNDKNGG